MYRINERKTAKSTTVKYPPNIIWEKWTLRRTECEKWNCSKM